MSDWSKLLACLREDGPAIGRQARVGNELALQVVRLYKTAYISPDEIIGTLLAEAYREWKDNNAATTLANEAANRLQQAEASLAALQSALDAARKDWVSKLEDILLVLNKLEGDRA